MVGFSVEDAVNSFGRYKINLSRSRLQVHLYVGYYSIFWCDNWRISQLLECFNYGPCARGKTGARDSRGQDQHR